MLHFIYYYAECHYAECRYAECHYAKCRYAECHGAVVLKQRLFLAGTVDRTVAVGAFLLRRGAWPDVGRRAGLHLAVLRHAVVGYSTGNGKSL